MKQNTRSAAMPMIVTGMLVTFVTVACGRLAFGLILPFMREDLGLTYQQVGNLGTATSLGYICLVMAAGAFAARYGGRNAVLIGVALTIAGFIGLSLSTSYVLLFAWMVLLGFGTAFSFTPVISLLAGCFPHRRGAVIGMTNSGIGIGLLCASAVVPYLGASYDEGWRLAWLAYAAIGAVTVAAIIVFLPAPRQQIGPVAAEQPGNVYRNPRVILVGLLYGVIGTTHIVQSTFMYSYALDAGVPVLTAARLAALLGILSIVAAPCWGLISDRFGRSSALTVAVTFTLIGTAIPVFWPTVTGFALHYIILGCTVSGMFTSVLATAAESVPASDAARATSYVTLFYAAGQLAGPAVAGVIIDLSGFRTAFTASCVLIAASLLLCRRLSRLRLVHA